MNQTQAAPKGTKEAMRCACGKGALSVDVLTFGNWQVVTLLEPCGACGSTDLKRKQKAHPVHVS